MMDQIMSKLSPSPPERMQSWPHRFFMDISVTLILLFSVDWRTWQVPPVVVEPRSIKSSQNWLGSTWSGRRKGDRRQLQGVVTSLGKPMQSKLSKIWSSSAAPRLYTLYQGYLHSTRAGKRAPIEEAADSPHSLTTTPTPAPARAPTPTPTPTPIPVPPHRQPSPMHPDPPSPPSACTPPARARGA